jgi:uncharacterized membrane protein
MGTSVWGKAYILFLALAAGFVWISSRALPDVVASHFGGSGLANGYMSHDGYVAFMLALLVGLAVFVVLLPNWLIAVPGARINLPNRDYWLAPERRAATVATLRGFMLRIGTLLTAILVYAHWLVVEANALTPPRLDNTWFLAGLAVFVLATLASVAGLIVRFARVPSKRSP